ncbi:MAG: respiratory nitrate reductase subunit gamma [Chloroflexota bacterium]
MLLLLGWFSAALFVIVSAYKMYKIAAAPLNVRWEVYPVPHEEGARRHYGGSYMEEVGWAKKTRAGSLIAEVVEMSTEIFLLQRVRKHNPYGVWLFSMAMHWGLYLGVGLLGLLVIENLIALPALALLTNIVGVVAFALGTLGALGLVVRRATDRNLSLYTTPLDYFNLFLLAAIFVLGLASVATAGSFAAHRAYIGGVLRFQPTMAPPLVALTFLVFELFVIYMPFSKLIHYFAKYFTYHSQLWDDAFKAKGSPTDKKVAEQLAYTAAWSAPHVVAGKSWLEQAQNTNVEGEKK